MGFCCNGFGWGSWMGWGGSVLSVVFFAGALVLLGLGTVWLIRQLGRRPLAQGADVEKVPG